MHSLATKKDPFFSVQLTGTTSAPILMTRAKRCASRLGQVRASYLRNGDQHQTTDSDRILYQGSLDLAVYNRAELKSSDHKPVFALFRTAVWIVDRVKQDALAGFLLENVTSTSNEEKLDEKLAALTLRPSTKDCLFFDCVFVLRL